MESWAGYNVSTTDIAEWLYLMNLSTQEWGLAYLPPGIYVWDPTLNDSFHFPDNSTIIRIPSYAHWTTVQVEGIACGIAAAIALLWAIWYIWRNYKEIFGSQSKTRALSSDEESKESHPHMRETRNAPGAHPTTVWQGEPISDATFRHWISKFYYLNIVTEVELYENDCLLDGVEAEDVVAVTELVRKMCGIDFDVWRNQQARYGISAGKGDELRIKSDAMLAEVRRIIAAYTRQRVANWTAAELEQLQAISRILREDIPESRYGINLPL